MNGGGASAHDVVFFIHRFSEMHTGDSAQGQPGGLPGQDDQSVISGVRVLEEVAQCLHERKAALH